jgi:bifunctional NMN adenylyltransferase/nudix hydrolase
MSELTQPFTTNVAKDFHCGLSVVDMVLVDFDRKRIALGRRPHREQYQFPGGFADVIKDNSLEDAAKRELAEEMPRMETTLVGYIGSLKVNDSRYKDDKDKIMTSVFVFCYIYGELKGGDDLPEAAWFDINKIKYQDVISQHKDILDIFLQWWINGGEDYLVK